MIERGLLTEEILPEKDQAGLPIIQKQFDLDGLHQAALWVKTVTDKIVQHDDAIEEIKAENAELKAENEEMGKRLAKLEAAEEARKKKEALERNKVVNAVYPME